MKKITKLFLEHPRSVNETYWEHFFFASKATIFLFKMTFALFVHSLLPFLFKTYVSENIVKFQNIFLKRNQEEETEIESKLELTD